MAIKTKYCWVCDSEVQHPIEDHATIDSEMNMLWITCEKEECQNANKTYKETVNQKESGLIDFVKSLIRETGENYRKFQ